VILTGTGTGPNGRRKLVGDELHGVQYGHGWSGGYGEGGTQGEREMDAVLTAIL
jgi:hypothetical protein